MAHEEKPLTRESFIATMWDFSDHRMRSVYSSLAAVGADTATCSSWTRLTEDERQALRSAIVLMVEAHEHNRALELKKLSARKAS